MTRLEGLVLSVGALAIVIALIAVDWRLGLAALGLFLIVAAIDIRRPA